MRWAVWLWLVVMGCASQRANSVDGEPKPVTHTNPARSSSQAGCDRQDISNNVRAQATRLRACYEQQLATRPDLAGTVAVQWEINREGVVRSLELIKDTLHDAKVADCVLATLRAIRFAKPRRGVCVIQWPFVFTTD